MNIFAFFGTLLLLAAPSSAAAAGCTYKGQSYANLVTINHDNGCAILQCQFGTIATYYEACGKEIDDSCHRLNFMFEHQAQTYICKKIPAATGYEYKYEIASKIQSCEHEGKKYEHLAKFLCGRCGDCQCQSGNVYILNEACSNDIDDNCHLVGEIFVKNTVTYECTSRVENDLTIYQNKPLASPLTGSRSCSASNSTFKHLEIFKLPGSCNLRQCQDKTIKILTQACTFKQDNGKCYQIDEEWSFNNRTYVCVHDEVEGITKIEVVNFGYHKCKRAERWYNHLEIQTRADGCTSVQCQDGKTLPVEEGCLWKVDNKCYKLNFTWKSNGTFLKCVLTGDGLYRILTVDENTGEVIDRIPTTTVAPDFGDICPTIAADIIFVWDSSGSISRDNYARQLNFSCNVVGAFKVGPDNVQIGGVIFSQNAEKVFDLKTYSDVKSTCKAIKETPFLGDTTETQKALNLIVDTGMFSPESGGRPNVMDIVIIITDGNSTNTSITLEAANRLKALGVQVISLGVGHIKHDELYGIASRPENVFNISSYEAIFQLKKDISTRTCNVSIEPPVDPEEAQSVACPKTVADIIFLLDSSLDVGSENYKLKLDLAVNLTAQFTISPTNVQIGAVLIGTQATKVFDLNKYKSLGTVSKALAQAPYLQGTRETGSALALVLDGGLFKAAHGGRETVARVLVVLTDGPSADLNQTLTVAKKLRNDGVRIITVGIRSYSFREVVGLSGDRNNVFVAPDYSLLNFVKADLYARICEATKQPQPGPEPPRCTDTVIPPCDHFCENTDTGYVCSCVRGFVINRQNKSKCDDIDECKQKTNCQQLCNNTIGSYECSCKPGYVVSVSDPTKCEDIDECSQSLPCEHTCTNTDGSYTCSCKPGFVVSSSDPNKCEDIDECSQNSPCQQLCINTIGSYTCSCEPGYVVNAVDPTKCDDIDECSMIVSPCEHTCINTVGNYTCVCIPGYVVSASDPDKCEDVDECLDVVNPPCHHVCTNTVGSYKCSCKDGYAPNPCDTDICKDIDECEQIPCEHECINTRGSYQCT